ncbi:MAG: hypothetical protein ABI371_05225 [Gelidibacter sp.]
MKLLFILSLFIVSCSSNDDGPNQLNGNKSGYSLTIEGDKTYSGAWDGDSEEGAIISLYTKGDQEEGGTEYISLIIADDPNDFSLNGALTLNSQTQQPLPLGNLANDDMEDADHSSIIITIGDKNYISNSGSAKISNFKKTMFGPFSGFASYDMEIDGKFDLTDTKTVEQIKIKGTVRVISYL